MKTRAQESKESKKQGSEGPSGCAKRLNKDDKGVYEMISVTDSWHLLFLIDGRDGDDDHNSDDERVYMK